MNVGDYVRTNKGIAKIIDKLDNVRFSYPDAWVTDTYLEIYDDTEYIYDEDIIKSSSQIIKLIEKNDYVNGLLVVEKSFDYANKEWRLYDRDGLICTEKDIKSILTHEQMEAMQYRVEE